jgi:hypothetical protein
VIETCMGACWTIVFYNRSVQEASPTVWVCESETTYHNAMKRLAGLKHIEIVQNGPSHVEEEN